MSIAMLTRIVIGKTQAAQKGLIDAYAWHRALWEAFPGRDGEPRDFLFRVDDAGRDFTVLLLSDSEPQLPTWGHWQTKMVGDAFLAHPAYRFQLRANPTMRRSNDHRRLGIFDEDRLRDWLCRKGEQHGFGIVDDALVVGAPCEQCFVRNHKRGKHVAVDFRGLLRVVDRETFCLAFCRGVGSAKAFGFGLLMLEPTSL